MKYSIEKIFDLKKWDYLVDQSENSSIFFKSFFLIPLNEKIDYFIIKKNNKPISGFFLITDGKKNIVENDLIIHSGIFFIKEKNIKISSLNAQIHETTETFKNFIVQNYKKIKVSFLPEIQDIRSFQWHNYHNNKKKFKIDIKFTSFLNLKDFNPSNYLKSKLYLNLNENRKRNIQTAIKNKITFSDGNVEDFVKNYSIMFKNKGERVSVKKKDKLKDC